VSIIVISSGGNAKRSLRQVLKDSHVAFVAIALLLLWSLGDLFHGLWDPVSRLGGFFLFAIAIRDIPYFSFTLTTADRLRLIISGYFLYGAVASFSAAWLLSRWVYGMSPVRTLTECCSALTGRKHA
jgi:hypothetical protein